MIVMGRNSKSRKVITRSESGTCNVCSAPCSSCLHINRALTTVKAEESSGETCLENITSQYSVTDVPDKISICDSGQRAASETSNANSNCNVNYRNGENKAGVKGRDVSRASGDVKMPPTGGTVEHLCDKVAVKSKYEEHKFVEGHEDSTSCVTGGSEANRLASSDNKRVGLRNGLDELSSPKKELIDSSSSQDKKEGVQSSKLPNKLTYPSSAKSVSCKEENLVSNEDSSLSLTKEVAADLGAAEEGIDHCIQVEDHSMAVEGACLKVEEETNTGSSAASGKVGLELESGTLTNTVTENQQNKVDNSLVQNNETEKMESCELAGLPESNMESKTMVDSDEADVLEHLEHDVKVCDICGEAGREDLLAACSRCSDGAEHTYCMREMIDKVPEGDWLCEECKYLDEIKSKDAVVTVSVSDKCQSSEVASDEDNDLFLNVHRKNLDTEATKLGKYKLGKRDMDDRSAEDIEIPPVAKKQAVGSTVESPKGTLRAASLSRNSSFKNLNKGESKTHQSSNNEPLEDPSSLRGLRPQEARGTLSKSSSFSTNPKSKVEFFSEGSQKQKVVREPAHLDKKESASKFIGRSMSFKPSTLSRLNHSESKVKTLSPKFSHPQDVKGVRQVKAQNILERKSSIKPERQPVNTRMSSSTVSAPDSNQKLLPNDPCVSNNNELKGVPSDSKPSTPSKSTSFIARKGEIKINSVLDQRPKETGLKDDSPSGNYTAEKPFSNSRGGLPGVLSRSQETDKPVERIREGSVSRYRTHIDSPRNIVNDASATRSSADVIKGNKLKAAIEAAMLKKPGICRKNKPADQSDEVSMSSSSLNCETRSGDLLSISNKRSNMSSAHEGHEGRATSNGGDQSSLPLGADSLRSGDDSPFVSSGLSSQPSTTVTALLNMPILPEHEYIWQGGFEIRKIGKVADLRDGLQAHLSTCASPNVLEMVNKFPSKVLLYEVPRLSTWPVQFQEAGVKEDNIALYFFAKDLESYERSYKTLLETMMRRDLALKGNFDGVEILILPSNHLPQNAQRWNMMFFLWGVFRGKKVNCVQNISNSNACNASEASGCPATLDLPGTYRNVYADSNNSASSVLDYHASDNVKGFCDTQVSSSYSNGHCLQGNVEKRDLKVDSKRISGISVPETTSTTIPQEEKVDPKTKPDVAKVQPSVQDGKTTPSNTQQTLSICGTSARASPSDDLVILERTVKEGEESADASSVMKSNMLVDQVAKEPNKCPFSHGKLLCEDPIPEALNASITSGPTSAVLSEGESANKKQKMNSAVIESAGNSLFPEMVAHSGHALEGEMKAPKRGIELDLNETQDYTPDSPSPAAKQEKGGMFDLNVAQDYPPDKDEVEDGSSLLSLSLFPLSDKEPGVKPTSRMGAVLPGRPNNISSLPFFDGLLKK